MLKKISRKVFFERYPDFPKSNNYHNKFHYPEAYASYILYVESGSTTGLCNRMAKSLSMLMNKMDYKSIFFMGDTTTPWLFRDHDYRPVKSGLDYLADNKISKNFNGAIEVNSEDLIEFLRHIFWLVKCNGIVFIPYLTDAGFNFVASYCRYGNIHLSILNEETDLVFNEAIKIQPCLYLQITIVAAEEFISVSRQGFKTQTVHFIHFNLV